MFVEQRVDLRAPILRIQQLGPAHFTSNDFIALRIIKVYFQQLHVLLGFLILLLEKTLPVVLIPHLFGPTLVASHARLNVSFTSRAKGFAFKKNCMTHRGCTFISRLVSQDKKTDFISLII